MREPALRLILLMKLNEEVRREDDLNLLLELEEVHFEILLSYHLKLIFIAGPKLDQIQLGSIANFESSKSCLTERKVRR